LEITGKILHNVLRNLKEYVYDVKVHNFSFKDQKIVFYLSKNNIKIVFYFS